MTIDSLIAETKKALGFIADIALEELPYAKVGTGAEVALRHIHRKASETLMKLVEAGNV